MSVDLESFESASPVKPRLQRSINGHKAMTDRLPPYSEESERAILGSVMVEPKYAHEIFDRIGSDADPFYDLRHRVIYSTMLAMWILKEPIDLVTLRQWLKDDHKLDEVGGDTYIASLFEAVPSAANWSYYADTVLEKHLLRKMIQACSETIEQVYQNEGNVDRAVDVFEQNVLSVKNERIPKTAIAAKEACGRLMIDLERRMDLDGKLSGLDTGLHDLNRMTDGLQFGEQVVIGARPSMGKTALGLGIFRHCVFRSGIPALFISLEMSIEAIMRRIVSAEMNIPLSVVKKGSYNQDQMGRLAIFKGITDRHDHLLHIIDGVSGGMTMREITSSVRKMVLKFGIRLVVVDYLQKIRPDIKHEKRTYEVGDISGKLKALAVETNVAMLTLAQLNRENVNQKNRPPRLSDLADSGQIERDADTVGMLHRYDNGEMALLIGKQRDGETGKVDLCFLGEFVKFESVENQH